MLDRDHPARNTADVLLNPSQVCAPASDANDDVRDGAWVAELPYPLNLTDQGTGDRRETQGTAPALPAPW